MHCFRAAEPRVPFSTQKVFPCIHKDAVPSIQQSMVAYEYVCRCDCRYVDRISLHLKERINQHAPNFIRRKQQPTKILPERKCKIRSKATLQQCGLAIRLYLMQNPECATQYSNDQFFYSSQSKIHVSSFGIGSYIYQNQEANSLSSKRVCLFHSNFSPTAMQLVSNGNVAPLIGARTNFQNSANQHSLLFTTYRFF